MKQKQLQTEKEIIEFFDKTGARVYCNPVFEGTTLKRVSLNFHSERHGESVIEFTLDSYTFKCLVPDREVIKVYHTRVKTFPDMQRQGTKEEVQAFKDGVKATFGADIQFEDAESEEDAQNCATSCPSSFHQANQLVWK
jgi:hypothetical protein